MKWRDEAFSEVIHSTRRTVDSTSMYSEVFQWDRGSNVSNMAELFFTDASGGAAHTFGLSVQCEKIYKQKHSGQTTVQIVVNMQESLYE